MEDIAFIQFLCSIVPVCSRWRTCSSFISAILCFRSAQYSASSRWKAMAMAKYSSRSSSCAAMKASLVVMLLLGTVVAAHGRSLSCVNKCDVPIVMAGVTVEPGTEANVEVHVGEPVEFMIKDGKGYPHTGWYECPEYVTAVEVEYNRKSLCVKVKVAAVGLISRLLQVLLGLVLCIVNGVVY